VRPDAVSPYSWYVLAVLFLVYTLNYLDRSLIFILFPPIKRELQLTDLQIALLGSTSFVLFYALLGIPFGRLADRVVRKDLIAAGLCAWSLFSGLTGFMTSFSGIFLCRVLVGVGEATLGPAALSLLGDCFPPRMRATASAIYSAGIPIGAGLALFLGGLIGQRLGWRWAFFLLGFPGVCCAVLVLFLREPQRGQRDAPEAEARPDWRLLFRFPALRYHYLGYGLASLAAGSIGMWVPTYVTRRFHIGLAQVGLYSGIAAALGGLVGVLLGGAGADAWRRAQRGGRMLFCALGSLLAVPLWLLMLSTPSLAVLMACYGLLMAFGMSWLGPAAADIQDIVGPRLRGLGVGVYFFLVNLIAAGIAPPIIGKLNDLLGAAQDPAMMARSLLISPVACVVSAICLALGARHLNRGA
jgi:MFS family permease